MKKRRTVKKKKMSTGAKIAIGVVVAGGAYAAWEFLIKPMIEKSKDEKPKDEKPPADIPKNQEQVENQVQQVIEQVQQMPANVAPKPRLSPIGTPFNKIDYNAKIFYGDKGAEVEFVQSAYNTAIKWLNAKNSEFMYDRNTQRTPIATDGKFGKKTYQALKSVFTPKQLSSGITPKIALDWKNKVEATFATGATANLVGGTFGNVIANIGN